MGNALFKFPIPFSINYLRKKAEVNPLIVNYHVVSNEILPHIEYMYKFRNIDQFKNDLDILKKYYQPIDLHTFLDSIKNYTRIPENSLLLTIDDGLKEIYTTMAPVLLEKKVPATIFLTKNYIDNFELGLDHKKSLLINKLKEIKTEEVLELFRKFNININQPYSLNNTIISISYPERNVVDELARAVNINFENYLTTNKPYITSEQVNELKDQGFTFGGHSIDHARFVELNINEQVNQAKESVEFICNKFSIDYRVFAFPYWDGGISNKFFELIKDKVDATFGTQGLLNDSATINHQRISFERYQYSVQRMIKAHYTRKIIYQYFKRDIIKRT